MPTPGDMRVAQARASLAASKSGGRSVTPQAGAAAAPRATPAASGGSRAPPAAARGSSAARARPTPASSASRKRAGSGATPGDLRMEAAERAAASERRREQEDAEQFAAEEEARAAAEEALATDEGAAGAEAEAEAKAEAEAEAVVDTPASVAAAEASKPAESWLMSPRALQWLRGVSLGGVKPQRLDADTSRAAPAPALVAQDKRRTPPLRKRNSSVPTPLRTQLPDVAKGDAPGRAYGDHKLMAKRAGAGAGLGGGGSGGASSGAAPGVPSARSFVLRYLRFVVLGAAALLLSLAVTLALEKAGLFTANYNLLGGEVCQGGEGGGEACAWSWRSGGGSEGLSSVLSLFRILFLHPALALEYALNRALPLIPVSARFELPAHLVARASGILEGAYFLGVVYGVVSE